jgi:hypothetical protein
MGSQESPGCSYSYTMILSVARSDGVLFRCVHMLKLITPSATLCIVDTIFPELDFPGPGNRNQATKIMEQLCALT